MTEGIHTDNGSCARDRQRRARAAGQFAGLPIAQAALRFAELATRVSAGRSTTRRSSPIRSRSDRLLRGDGQPDEIIAAGLLHDVLEKTATTSAELQRRFGARIARLVESVSDDPSLGDYKSRKRELRDRVAHADPGTRRDLRGGQDRQSPRALRCCQRQQLNEPKNRAKLAHYRASLEMLRRADGDLPLTHRLDVELERLVARSGVLRRSSPRHA